MKKHHSPIRITISRPDVGWSDDKTSIGAAGGDIMSSCQNRRKFSSPASLLSPPLSQSSLTLSHHIQQPRRFSNVGVTARKFSQTIGWNSKAGAELTAEIVDQGRALCTQYIRSRLKRSGVFTKKCGLQRLRSAASLPGGFVVRQVLPELISIGTELERLHPKVYTGISRQVSSLPGGAVSSEKALAGAFTCVTKELSRNQITWAKVVSLFAVAGGLAVDCVRSGHPEYMHSIVDAMASSLESNLAPWIIDNGGWTGLCSYCKPPSTEISLSGFVGLLGALVAAAFLVVLIFKWFGKFAI